MTLERSRSVLPLAARDLAVAIAARTDFETLLEPLARRRAPYYLGQREAPLDDLYWPTIAQALAPIGPPEWMPMSGLLENGMTLEGGAKGFRGLFTREPSDKERKRVQKTATLAARVMEIVVSGAAALNPAEQRLTTMTMASFGLTGEELERTRPVGPMTYESLEIFGDLDARTRRELLRGAWQLAVADKLEPARELSVRGIAARLEVTAECDALRAEVIEQQGRRVETAIVAVELARVAARDLDAAVMKPWFEHLLDAVSPVTRRAELAEIAYGSTTPQLEALPRIDAPRRLQALSLALVTLLGHDPTHSAALYLRSELRYAALQAGLGAELPEAIAVVDRYLFERVRDIVQADHDARALAEGKLTAPASTAGELPPGTPPSKP